MLVHELMSAPVVVAPPSLSLPDAAHLMKSRGIRRLPVVDGSRLVGIVTDRDLREALPSKVSSLSPWEATTRLAAVSVQDVMRRSVLTTTPDADARDAAHTLLHHRVGALPVIDAAGTVVGLLTVSDVLRDYARPAQTQNRTEARP
ncbi:CBS domain-containing protein [Deinococcus saxicola]|uniref:CBS domain-containing protein n=1 Tax=Deinococcus saxicola TaxID=249406 RepID=UPI0039EF21D3